jgi:hypothetical protein
MWSMSLSTLPPLSPGEEDDAPLLEAPPVVKKSGRTSSPRVDPPPSSDEPLPTPAPAFVPTPARTAPTTWLLIAAVCLIVLAALAGYFIGRGPR